MRDRLESFLAARGVQGKITDIEQLTGGYSQITYRFTLEDDGGRRHFVQRSDRPSGARLTSTDRALEFRVIQALNRVGAAVPVVRWNDIDGDELGTPSLISDFVVGQNMLQAARADVRPSGELADLVTQAAAQIHSLDVSGLPGELDRPVDWSTYIDEQIQAWRDMEARQSEPMPIVRYLASWLDLHRPQPVELRLVHGEYSLANLMLGPDGAVTVIDWEYAHIGDPRMDLGWCIQRGGKEPPNILRDHIDRVCLRYRELTGMSETAMNPAAIAYFVVLSGWRAFGEVLDGISRFSTGERPPLLSAYLVSPWSLACAEWLGITQELDSAAGRHVGAQAHSTTGGIR
jgi:aminoglycoside phosphotransferase (APT) family kinase protein